MEFLTAFEKVIGFEGVFSDDPNDPGKATKFGISKRAYPKLDIPNLTLDDAQKIYRADYWSRSHCDELPDGLDFLVFDLAVNSGVGKSLLTLREALGLDETTPWEQVQFSIGEADCTKLAVRFLAARLRFLTGLETWDHYGKGWSRRVADNMLLISS